MKTLKSIFVISAILLVSGYTYATGKGPTGSDEVRKEVREKIAAAIETADIQGHGQVMVKFGVTDKNGLQILQVESKDKFLSETVKKALTGAQINFPKGSKGVYSIKVYVNETADLINYDMVRNQVFKTVTGIQHPAAGSVKVKFRAIYPSTMMVVKAESADKALAQKVKKAIENGDYLIPKKLNGEYTLTVSVK